MIIAWMLLDVSVLRIVYSKFISGIFREKNGSRKLFGAYDWVTMFIGLKHASGGHHAVSGDFIAKFLFTVRLTS